MLLPGIWLELECGCKLAPAHVSFWIDFPSAPPTQKGGSLRHCPSLSYLSVPAITPATNSDMFSSQNKQVWLQNANVLDLKQRWYIDCLNFNLCDVTSVCLANWEKTLLTVSQNQSYKIQNLCCQHCAEACKICLVMMMKKSSGVFCTLQGLKRHAVRMCACACWNEGTHLKSCQVSVAAIPKVH